MIARDMGHWWHQNKEVISSPSGTFTAKSSNHSKLSIEIFPEFLNLQNVSGVFRAVWSAGVTGVTVSLMYQFSM